MRLMLKKDEILSRTNNGLSVFKHYLPGNWRIGRMPEHFAFCLDLLSSEEKEALWNSARNADMEYVPGVTYTVTLDGFIISDNIECLSYENINTGYSYSDHDPVKVNFVLK
mgnify:CR=1 FL=1